MTAKKLSLVCSQVDMPDDREETGKRGAWEKWEWNILAEARGKGEEGRAWLFGAAAGLAVRFLFAENLEMIQKLARGNPVTRTTWELAWRLFDGYGIDLSLRLASLAEEIGGEVENAEGRFAWIGGFMGGYFSSRELRTKL